MRRHYICTVLVLLFLVCSYAFSGIADSRVLIGSGNDKWAYVDSYNQDDKLTFSFESDMQFGDYGVDIDLASYTNRGVYMSGEYENGRFDSLKVLPFYTFTFQPAKDIEICLKPGIGLSVVGNLGLENIQNANHRSKGIPEVHLPYDDVNIISPVLSFVPELSYTLMDGEHRITVSGKAEYSINYMILLSGGIAFGNETGSLEGFSLGVSYEKRFSLTSNVTQIVSDDYLSGLKMDFVVDSGLLRIRSTSGNESGYSVISFDPLAFFRPREFQEADFEVSYYLSRFLGTNYNGIEFEHMLTDSLSVCFENRVFIGNFDFKRSSRTISRLAMFDMGLSYEFDDSWSKEWVSPYVSLELGLGKYELIIMNNDAESYAIDDSANVPVMPIVELTVGTTLLPPGLLVTDYASYQIIADYSLIYLPNTSGIADMLKSHNGLYVPNALEHSFSIGLHILFDEN